MTSKEKVLRRWERQHDDERRFAESERRRCSLESQLRVVYQRIDEIWQEMEFTHDPVKRVKLERDMWRQRQALREIDRRGDENR